MWIYIIILGVVWIVLQIPVVQERHAWLAFAHVGVGLFFTSLLLSLAFPQTGDLANITWLKIIGFVLIIPAVVLIVFAIVAITQRDLVKTGIMSIVRHPMYFGTAIASFALILIFQSILSIVLSGIAIIILWMASKLEDDYNIEQFGESYREFMAHVPRWNVLRGLKKG